MMYCTKLTGRRFLLAAIWVKILSSSLNNGLSNFIVVWLNQVSLINSSYVDTLAFTLPSFDPAAIFILKHRTKAMDMEAVSLTMSVFTRPDHRTK
jgi:hypothetical protein